MEIHGLVATLLLSNLMHTIPLEYKYTFISPKPQIMQLEKPKTMAKLLSTTTTLITTAIFLASLLPPSEPATPTVGAVSIKETPPQEPDCLGPVANMADCLTYVEEGSNLTEPESPCCPEISNLLKTNPICLCKLLANSTDFGISDVNITRALVLPSRCNIDNLSPSACQAVGVPVTIATPPGASEAAAAAPGLPFTLGSALAFFTYLLYF